MAKFAVQASRKRWESITVTVEAEDEEDAHRKVNALIDKGALDEPPYADNWNLGDEEGGIEIDDLCTEEIEW